MRSNSTTLTAALHAAARGWHVFPLRPGTKKPALHGVRHCPRTAPCVDGHLGWEQRATTDPDTIRRCWSAGEFNIGIATGPSGLVVVDLDTPKSPADVPPDGWNREGVLDGHDVFDLLCREAGQPVPWETFSVRTTRGGTHLYYRAHEGTALRSTKGEEGNGLGWKVDTRAHGGYVVAPGSSTPTGSYTITDDLPVADLPPWLHQRLTPKPVVARTAAPQTGSEQHSAYVDAAVRGECDKVAAAASGRHSSVLFTAAVALGQLVGGQALPSATAENALHQAAAHMVNSRCGCTDREITRTITNGLRAGISRPRTIPKAGNAA
ncbi:MULTISPECIES: bifunctional DNA primase/polymerase [Actinosynnema]|uniref:bifunctional DNA primase/polymerase n=1 Tax=Actinosynnema TaxID=40566 RepID=UPI0020A557C7|nr:bifunctional DNA primase/polymerase [Actinosynnema pretiosum]MCP2098988.1 Bifunctional DNA primase/polymerase, N-terminal [Actinosynnema pretiosum]